MAFTEGTDTGLLRLGGLIVNSIHFSISLECLIFMASKAHSCMAARNDVH